LEQGNLKVSKGKPKIESLNDDPVHQKIVRGIKINYSHEVLATHRFYNDITLLPGTGKLDGSSEGLDTILGMVF
jgi:hypothetical protein